jgi:hypothetical protein
MSSERLAAYRAFVAAEPNKDDGYLFETPRCRFTLEPSDELVAAPGAKVGREGEQVFVVLPGGARLPVAGISESELRSTLAALPCRYSRLVALLGPLAPSLIEQAFSKVLFAPSAVAALEVELPSVELTRFPGSPYEVVRAYWQNSIAVRRRIEESEPSDVAELRALLLELHELLLLGDGDPQRRSSFYLPASLLGRKRPEPGRFYDVPTGLERRGAETILTSGARVSVPLLGGEYYWQLLAESVDDAAALAAERQLELDGVPLGQVLRARAEDETQARPWFLPPRPLEGGHFAAILKAWQDARTAAQARDVNGALSALAAFHHRFVRVHPLPSGNQSLSMSFVNAFLRPLLGAGIPHLLLDQMALRFQLVPYQRLFTRAVRAWSTPWPHPGERVRQLMHMRAGLDGFVREVGNALSLMEARALITTHPRGAELSLLSDTIVTSRS